MTEVGLRDCSRCRCSFCSRFSFFGILLPTLAVTVRRLHDAGYSGLVALLFLLPYLGSLIMMIFALLPSSPAGAKYDPPGDSSPLTTPIRRRTRTPL